MSSKWSRLADLSRVVKQLSEQKCVSDLEDLFKHVESVEARINDQEATIKSQEETMMTKSNEVIRLKKEHRDRQEEVIELHTGLLRKKDDEKSALKQALTRQQSELDEATTSTQHLQEHIQMLETQLLKQDAEVKRTESQLHEARSNIELLEKDLKDHRNQMKSKEQQWQAEQKVHGQSKSQAEALSKRCADLEAELKASNRKLQQIEELAPPLIEDNAAEVSKGIQKIWRQCFHLGQVCFRDGNPPEQLKDSSRWRTLQRSNLVTYAVPLPPTNTPAAKRMRLFTALSILANSLIRNLFTSTYICSCTELDRVMLEVADANQSKEALFRRLLNSISTEMEDQLLEDRINKVTDEMAGCIEPLLSVEQSEKMRSDLTEILKLASNLWKSVQKRQSYFTVEPQSPAQTTSTWKSLFWNEEKKSFVEEGTTAPQDVVLVLFPRVLMVSHEGEQEIFPGVVLLKPDTIAAHAELRELPPASPQLTRTGTHRSAGGRRGTIEKTPERGSFLAQNGSQELSAL